jgi:hypothetical protein
MQLTLGEMQSLLRKGVTWVSTKRREGRLGEEEEL